MKNIAIILGAGKSTRCGFDKILHEQNGVSNLERCINTFSSSEMIRDVWVVLSEEQSTGSPLGERGDRIKGIIKGGKERFFSVKNAIEHCKEHYGENVRLIFHNGANPNLNIKDLESGIKLAEEKKNVIFGFFTPNSIKQVDRNGLVNKFLDREQVFETQTPQISDLKTFGKALKNWIPDQVRDDKGMLILPKDEAELLKLIDEEIYVYKCDPNNTKVTYTSDFTRNACHPEFISGSTIKFQEVLNQVQNDTILFGIGEDSHRFSKDFDASKPFRLGGLDVSGGTLSSDGNSDGDIIIHALCNALLSAYGDKTFDPIAAPICAAGDTNSVSYLEATLQYLANNYQLQNPSALRAAPLSQRGAKIEQILISLEGAQPKVAPHHDAIQENLAKLLNIEKNQIGLTYTTGEGLNDCGKGLGMRSFVVIILQ